MNISENGKNLIKKYEGCRLTAYKCPAGVWTIGWGHTKTAKEGMVITQEEADRLFNEDIKRYEEPVQKYKNLNQNQYDALVSFTYNCGAGALADVMSSNNVAATMLLYVNGGGKRLEGLVKRRHEEVTLYKTLVKTTELIESYAEIGTATVLVDVLNVRNKPSLNSNVVAKYYKNEKIYYSKVYINEGYAWIEYISSSGQYRYVASRKLNSNEKYLYCV